MTKQSQKDKKQRNPSKETYTHKIQTQGSWEKYQITVYMKQDAGCSQKNARYWKLNQMEAKTKAN